MRKWQRDAMLLVLSMVGGDHEPRKVDNPWKLEKGREQIVPQNFCEHVSLSVVSYSLRPHGL